MLKMTLNYLTYSSVTYKAPQLKSYTTEISAGRLNIAIHKKIPEADVMWRD